LSTQQKIKTLMNNFAEFLIEKNNKYGNSAIDPIDIFSHLIAKNNKSNGIYSRLDDKLSRIKNSNKLNKNDVSDLFGYIALLLVNKEWIDFKELID